MADVSAACIADEVEAAPAEVTVSTMGSGRCGVAAELLAVADAAAMVRGCGTEGDCNEPLADVLDDVVEA